MSKIEELLADLKSVTERSQPNIKFREQMDLIEALEAELISPPLPTESIKASVAQNIESEETVPDSSEPETTVKRGRKAKSE